MVNAGLYSLSFESLKLKQNNEVAERCKVRKIELTLHYLSEFNINNLIIFIFVML